MPWARHARTQRHVLVDIAVAVDFVLHDRILAGIRHLQPRSSRVRACCNRDERSAGLLHALGVLPSWPAGEGAARRPGRTHKPATCSRRPAPGSAAPGSRRRATVPAPRPCRSDRCPWHTPLHSSRRRAAAGPLVSALAGARAARSQGARWRGTRQQQAHRPPAGVAQSDLCCTRGELCGAGPPGGRAGAGSWGPDCPATARRMGCIAQMQPPTFWVDVIVVLHRRLWREVDVLHLLGCWLGLLGGGSCQGLLVARCWHGRGGGGVLRRRRCRGVAPGAGCAVAAGFPKGRRRLLVRGSILGTDGGDGQQADCRGEEERRAALRARWKRMCAQTWARAPKRGPRGPGPRACHPCQPCTAHCEWAGRAGRPGTVGPHLVHRHRAGRPGTPGRQGMQTCRPIQIVASRVKRSPRSPRVHGARYLPAACARSPPHNVAGWRSNALWPAGAAAGRPKLGGLRGSPGAAAPGGRGWPAGRRLLACRQAFLAR